MNDNQNPQTSLAPQSPPTPTANRPGKVTTAGVLMMIAGGANIILSGLFSCGALGGSIQTFGGSLLCLPFTLVLLPVGVAGIWYGFRLMSPTPPNAQHAIRAAGAQLIGVTNCSMLAAGLSIIALVFLNDPEVEAWLQEHGEPLE